MAVHPLGFYWRKNLMNPMSLHFVKSTLQPDEHFFVQKSFTVYIKNYY